jgi:hypothetical protein
MCFAHVQRTGFTHRGVMMAHRAELRRLQPLPWLWRSCCSLCNARRRPPPCPSGQTNPARRPHPRPCLLCLLPRRGSPSGWSNCCCGHHAVAKQSSAVWGESLGKRRNSPFVRAGRPSGCWLRLVPFVAGTVRFPPMTRDQGSAAPFSRIRLCGRSVPHNPARTGRKKKV